MSKRPRTHVAHLSSLAWLCAIAAPAVAQQVEPDSAPQPEVRSSWSDIDATAGGITIGRSDFAEVQIGGYFLVRYIDQQTQDAYEDHLGNEYPIEGRRDIQFHRAMIHVKGWLGHPKLRFQASAWSLMSTDQDVIYGFIGYQAHEAFNLYAGVNTIGGSRSLFGSHPFWLSHDRVMADEFFRGFFSGGVWANGEVLPGLWYHVGVMDNNSSLSLSAKDDTRDMAYGASVRRRTRRSVSRTRASSGKPARSRPASRVQTADYELYSADAGFKYKGVFLQTHDALRRVASRSCHSKSAHIVGQRRALLDVIPQDGGARRGRGNPAPSAHGRARRHRRSREAGRRSRELDRCYRAWQPQK